MIFRATVLTLYPEMFPGALGLSLAGRALEAGTWSLEAVQIRDFATDRHRTVDDTPAGAVILCGRFEGVDERVIAARNLEEVSLGDFVLSGGEVAALALLDSLAAELKGTGVRVNTILPSIIDTEPNRQAMPKADFAKWPKPEDIARVILFLCSEDANVVHGAALPVYGNS